ncbi:MAG TPA: transporter substrate-binding domain-containing protein [Myxococcota bacterium]|jgi:polar amino acid transport system substrate-binding protein|nr:transporter substrate-binding domain-containing protein [Myxococcota bacterium]
MALSRSLRCLSLVLLTLAAGACRSWPDGASPSAGGGGRLPEILSRGELRVGLTAAQPPLNMKTRSGEITGLDVDLVDALAEAMELRVALVEMPFAELLPALESGKVDLVVSGVTITPARNARVAFAGPYYVTGTSLLTRQRALAQATDFAALDQSGKTYVALAGSTSERFITTKLPQAKVVTTPDYDTAIRTLLDGKADAMVADAIACAVAVWQHPDAGLLLSASPFTAEPLGIALPGNDPLFVNLVQNYLDTLEKTGVLAELKARWLSEGPWIHEMP